MHSEKTHGWFLILVYRLRAPAAAGFEKWNEKQRSPAHRAIGSRLFDGDQRHKSLPFQQIQTPSKTEGRGQGY